MSIGVEHRQWLEKEFSLMQEHPTPLQKLLLPGIQIPLTGLQRTALLIYISLIGLIVLSFGIPVPFPGLEDFPVEENLPPMY